MFNFFKSKRTNEMEDKINSLSLKLKASNDEKQFLKADIEDIYIPLLMECYDFLSENQFNYIEKYNSDIDKYCESCGAHEVNGHNANCKLDGLIKLLEDYV